jgi:hypothetical protein
VLMALMRLVQSSVVPAACYKLRMAIHPLATPRYSTILRTRRAPLATMLRILARLIRPCAYVAGDVAAQIAARRGRRELTRVLALLPCVERGGSVGPPVPARWSLLCERRCGDQ